MACVLLGALRRLALQQTQFAKATCGAIRLKLLKIGALVRVRVRRITFATASGYLYQRDFAASTRNCLTLRRADETERANNHIRPRQSPHHHCAVQARGGCEASSPQYPRVAAAVVPQILRRYEKSGLRRLELGAVSQDGAHNDGEARNPRLAHGGWFGDCFEL
jgi:hypothetical protein